MPMHHLLISFLIFSLTPTPTTSLNSDGLSLLALKAAVDSDPTGVLSSWSETDGTPCHWPGVSCSGDKVSQVSLPNKTLSGYIPSELGFLTSLKRLSLPHNNFSNAIPPSLFNATSLIVLSIIYSTRYQTTLLSFFPLKKPKKVRVVSSLISFYTSSFPIQFRYLNPARSSYPFVSNNLSFTYKHKKLYIYIYIYTYLCAYLYN